MALHLLGNFPINRSSAPAGPSLNRPPQPLSIRRHPRLCSGAVDRAAASTPQPIATHLRDAPPVDSLDHLRQSDLETASSAPLRPPLPAIRGPAAVADCLQKLKSDVNETALRVAQQQQQPATAATAIAGTRTSEPHPKLATKPTRKRSKNERIEEAVTRAVAKHSAEASAAVAGAATVDVAADPRMYTPEERKRIRASWKRLMRWSKSLRTREAAAAAERKLEKVVVFGGGSFGTAMGVSLAREHPQLQVSLLLRDAYLCRDINSSHRNTRYLSDFELPHNVTATTSAAEAIAGAQYAIHAVPVQHSRAFLTAIKDLLPPTLPIISVSKGVEVATGQVMSDLIPSALGRKQPTAFLSGPSFATEVMMSRPTGIVAASKDRALARDVQKLFASPTMRVNTSNDVIGVEVCGALKNVLAIAAGIVEGLDLGNNAMAALVAQGCAEIRWLSLKMGAKAETISGLSGLGDIMLTCYGSLSRNRSVGVKLGRGEALADILSSSSQIAEGVATAGVVVSLARKYRVELPVLTAVAQVLNGHISAAEAVAEIMMLPQVEER